MVKISLLGDVALGMVSSSGMLDRLTAEVTTGDVLTQLNALELLIPLAVSHSGMNLLVEGGVISKLQYLLSLAETDPMAALLMPGKGLVCICISLIFLLPVFGLYDFLLMFLETFPLKNILEIG